MIVMKASHGACFRHGAKAATRQAQHGMARVEIETQVEGEREWHTCAPCAMLSPNMATMDAM